MPLYLHSGNRLEQLADACADLLRAPLPDPLAREIVVVQSRGMERWLATAVARRSGVWANVSAPFPNTFAWEMFRSVLPNLPTVSTLSPEQLSWRIMALLPGLLGEAGFEGVRDYLRDDREGLKLFQLSGVVADLFDQYTLFRPEMLRGWEEGRECRRCRWQARLWRAVAGSVPEPRRADLLTEFRRRLRTGGVDHLLPTRVTVFGIPALPLFHLDLLAALGEWTDVHIFLLNPCREYWARIVSEREKARLERRGVPAGELADYFETGNALLASLGGLGRSFIDLLHGEYPVIDGIERYDEPGDATLLAALQSGILTLTELGRRPVDPGDDSLRIHVCHSPQREIEVLYDTLLDLFRRDPTLEPRDVLVMTPDIERYAPYAEAVFGGVRDDRLRIPFAVSDRSAPAESLYIRTFLGLLDLATGRYGVATVLDLLEAPPLMARFGITPVGMATIRHWVTETGIRWGIDGAQRGRAGLPPFEEHSWRAALDRLLLGYALPGEGRRLCHDVLPYDDLEGGDSTVLAQLLDVTRRLFALPELLAGKRSISAWGGLLLTLCDDFLAVDRESEGEASLLRQTCARLAEQSVAGGFAGEVRLGVILDRLHRRLGEQRATGRFLSGGVTFCAMLPMRSIPFRVICLVGMNDGAFPRQDRSPEFSLMTDDPRPGDRSIRAEDRYLFLEALLSARDRLHISYTGRSVRDNAAIPPSVVVSELLDYLEQSLCPESSGCRDSLVVLHRLQPFSPAYFSGEDDRLFSYSAENCRAAATTRRGTGMPPPLLAAPLPEPSAEFRTLTLDTLVRFLRNPAAAFLRHRLGVVPDAPEGPLDEREPFALDPLQSYPLTGELVEAILAGEEPDGLLPILRGSGRLPPGEPGMVTFQRLRDKAVRFAERVRPHCVGSAGRLPVDLEVGPFRLTGMIDGLRDGGLLRYRCATLKAGDYLSCWLGHLALCHTAIEPTSGALLIGTDRIVRFGPVTDAAERLADLLALWWEGLREPLPFFPASALALVTGGPAAALGPWHGNRFTGVPGEMHDTAISCCFGDLRPDRFPCEERFFTLAQRVWGPLLAARTEVMP